MPIVRTGTEADAAAIDVIVLAFASDPAARWTWPDPHQYLSHFPNFVNAIGGKAFAHGSAHYLEGYTGAALWLPPNVQPDEDELFSLFQRTVAEELHKDVFAVFEQMGRYHPALLDTLCIANAVFEALGTIKDGQGQDDFAPQ